MHVKTLCEYNIMTLIYFCRFTYLLFYLFFCCPGALFYIIDGFLISQKISIFQNFLTLLALNIMKKILPSRAKKFFKSLCWKFFSYFPWLQFKNGLTILSLWGTVILGWWKDNEWMYYFKIFWSRAFLWLYLFTYWSGLKGN